MPNKRTCAALRLAGLDLGVIWEDENLDEGTASVRFVDGDREGQEELAILLDKNSGEEGKVSIGKDDHIPTINVGGGKGKGGGAHKKPPRKTYVPPHDDTYNEEDGYDDDEVWNEHDDYAPTPPTEDENYLADLIEETEEDTVVVVVDPPPLSPSSSDDTAEEKDPTAQIATLRDRKSVVSLFR